MGIKHAFIVQNEYSERVIEFLAQFIAHMTSNKEVTEDLNDDSPIHEFLTDIVAETLQVIFLL